MTDSADNESSLTVLEFNDGQKWRLVTTPEELSEIKDQIECSLSRDSDVIPFRSTGFKQEIPTLTDLVPEFAISPDKQSSSGLTLDDPGFYFEENDRKAVFALEDSEGNPKALVQLYGIYIDEIAVEYTHVTEFAMSSLRGEVGARLFINRDPMKPLQRDYRISVSSSLLDQLR